MLTLIICFFMHAQLVVSVRLPHQCSKTIDGETGHECCYLVCASSGEGDMAFQPFRLPSAARVKALLPHGTMAMMPASCARKSCCPLSLYTLTRPSARPNQMLGPTEAIDAMPVPVSCSDNSVGSDLAELKPMTPACLCKIVQITWPTKLLLR